MVRIKDEHIFFDRIKYGYIIKLSNNSNSILDRKKGVTPFPQCKDITIAFKSSNTPEPRKKTSYFPLYSLVNRDPYSGLL